MSKFQIGIIYSFVIVLSFNVKISFGQTMSGAYTIGGVSPDFTSFTQAVDTVVNKGVSGPVIFNVRDGSYIEQISIASISGVSATNTITFQSQNTSDLG